MSELVDPKDLLVFSEAADYLGFEVTTFKNLICRGKAGFPEPIHGSGDTGIWLKSEIGQWYKDMWPKTVAGQRAILGSERSRTQRPVARGLRRAS